MFQIRLYFLSRSALLVVQITYIYTIRLKNGLKEGFFREKKLGLADACVIAIKPQYLLKGTVRLTSLTYLLHYVKTFFDNHQRC